MVLIDTGPLVALLSVRDQYHERACAITRKNPPPMFTTWPVITEACWLLRKSPVATSSLFHALKTGLLEVVPLEQQALDWIHSFLRRYTKIESQLADASLCYLAELHDTSSVFTFDFRDFTVYRIHKNKMVPLVENA